MPTCPNLLAEVSAQSVYISIRPRATLRGILLAITVSLAFCTVGPDPDSDGLLHQRKRRHILPSPSLECAYRYTHQLGSTALCYPSLD